jgi:SAM-dependent methyltransferase
MKRPILDQEVKQKEKRHYDEMTEDRNEFAEHPLCRFMCDKQFRYLDPALWSGKRILDAACGEARYTRAFAHDGALESVGIDISQDYMMRNIKEDVFRVNDHLYPLHRSLPNLKLLKGDVENLSKYHENYFDTVCIFLALHHLPNHRRFLGEVMRTLKPEGVFVLVEPNGSNPLRGLVDLIGRGVGYMSEDEKSFKLRELHGLLKEAGFENIDGKSLNLFSEGNYLFSWIVRKKIAWFGRAVLELNRLFIPLDTLLESTLFRLFPSLSWRVMITAVKPKF